MRSYARGVGRDTSRAEDESAVSEGKRGGEVGRAWCARQGEEEEEEEEEEDEEEEEEKHGEGERRCEG